MNWRRWVADTMHFTAGYIAANAFYLHNYWLFLWFFPLALIRAGLKKE